jgi:hypothetical protein
LIIGGLGSDFAEAGDSQNHFHQGIKSANTETVGAVYLDFVSGASFTQASRNGTILGRTVATMGSIPCAGKGKRCKDKVC